ncbi:probable LRR receptor-like serine/threonine-protein kinase At1g51880 [Pyrus x bretschneideri]|uniref:probable LRR receptor-like serine/threonine-protein kinase At1g51880 n=1 Tax=Pyrus x bretschneideri TaxID=225117 RepID=UPI00202DB71B|nr:probable LRR receptor-like serine/threonine-protein kinase At1g51880 [Pyrus x bretschneideri]
MNTVRSFPNQNQQNCYVLPYNASTQRYLIRAGFYYGDYDGLSRPPPFDLHINGRTWSTVKASTAEGPLYHEAMYVNQGSGSLNVCVVQVEKGMVPFVSSVEAVPIYVLTGPLYPKMETSYAYDLVSRVNLGGNEVRYAGPLSEERYNRVWTRGTTPPNCVQVPTVATPLPLIENDPPIPVLLDSIQSLKPSDPIILSVDLPHTTPQSAYIVLYFAEMATLPKPNDSRIIDIYINGQRLIGIRVESLCPSWAKGGFSKREERVARMGMALGELGVAGEEESE